MPGQRRTDRTYDTQELPRFACSLPMGFAVILGEVMKERGSSRAGQTFARLAFVAAFLLAGLVAAPLSTYAVGDVVIDSSAFSPGDTAIVNYGPLNLRSGAGTGYAVIEVLATGDYVEIQDGPYSADGYNWYQVYVDATGSVGFVAGVYLTLASSGGGFTIGDTVYVTSDVLNVRSGPGTGYSVIDVITYGTNGLIVDGPVSANGYIWYEIDYVGGASDGWVAGDYLGYVSGTGFAIGDVVYVTSSTLNVRSGPGTGYTIDDVLYSGDQGVIVDGPVYADGYTWYQINYGAGAWYGWVAGEYLGYVSSGGISVGDSVYVASASLNVRSGPGTGYSIDDVLTYGDTAVVIDGPVYADGYTWYQIEYSDPLYGWVAGEYLGLS